MVGRAGSQTCTFIGSNTRSSAQDDVGDEPVVEEPELDHRHREEVAHGAVGAVAADQVPALDDAGIGCAGDDVVVLAEVGDGAAAADVDAERAGSPFEQRVERRLVEHRRQWPARRPRPDAAQAQQRGSLAVAPLVDVARFGDLGELVADACGLQDSADLVVEVHRSGHRVGLWLTLEDRHRVAALGEQDRQREPDRSASDDDDVVHGWRSGWWPQALMRS